MKKILLLLNPSSRQGAENFEKVEKIIKEKGWQLVNSELESEKKSFDTLLDQYKDKFDVIMVGGGDGSVNEALKGLVETKKPLAILPLGTANNMARTLKIPSDLRAAIDIVEQNHILNVDLGLANNLYFVNVAGMGLSTQVNKTVSSGLKKWLGVFAFIITALRVARYLKPLHAEIVCDGKSYTRKFWQISICNGRNYGSGLTISEDATLTDEKLHALSTEVEKWWYAFLLIPSMMLGKYKPTHDVSLFEGKKITIKTRKPRSIDLDGDIKTQTPAVFEVLPKAIFVFTPREKN